MAKWSWKASPWLITFNGSYGCKQNNIIFLLVSIGKKVGTAFSEQPMAQYISSAKVSISNTFAYFIILKLA